MQEPMTFSMRGSSSIRNLVALFLGALLVLVLASDAFSRSGERHFFGGAHGSGVSQGLRSSQVHEGSLSDSDRQNLERIAVSLHHLKERSYTFSGESRVQTGKGDIVLVARLMGVNDPTRGFSVAVTTSLGANLAMDDAANEGVPYDEMDFFAREGNIYLRFSDEAAWQPVGHENRDVAREELFQWDPREHALRLMQYAIRITPVMPFSGTKNSSSVSGREVWEIFLDGSSLARDWMAACHPLFSHDTPNIRVEGNAVSNLSSPVFSSSPAPYPLSPAIFARYVRLLAPESHYPTELQYEERIYSETSEGESIEEIHVTTFHFHSFDQDVQFPDLLGIESP